MNVDKLRATLGSQLEDVRSAGPDAGPEDVAAARELVELERMARHLLNEEGENPPRELEAQSSADDDGVSPGLSQPLLQILTEIAGSLEFGSDASELFLPKEWTKLERAVKDLPKPVRRRLRKKYGIGITLALAEIEKPRKDNTGSLQVEISESMRSRQRWLEGLAMSLLTDAGAQTRDGIRTGGLSFDPGANPDGRYVVLDSKAGTFGHLTLPGLVEQLHLALVFSTHAWTGFETLKNAGRESTWALNEGKTRGTELPAYERIMLQAAEQIHTVLDRVGFASADTYCKFTALDQALITAEALAAVGPSVRAAIGWKGGSGIPDARMPEDVARVAVVATALHEGIKTISNRLIADHMIGTGTWADGGNP